MMWAPEERVTDLVLSWPGLAHSGLGQEPQQLKHRESWECFWRSLSACQPPGVTASSPSTLTYSAFHSAGVSFLQEASPGPQIGFSAPPACSVGTFTPLPSRAHHTLSWLLSRPCSTLSGAGVTLSMLSTTIRNMTWKSEYTINFYQPCHPHLPAPVCRKKPTDGFD